MLQKVKVTKVYKGQQETQWGLKDKVAIKTEQHGDKWLSCFMNKGNQNQLAKLKEGEVFELMVEQKGDFLNFRFADKVDHLAIRVARLENLQGIGQEDPTPQEHPADETQAVTAAPATEDIPF